MNPTDKNIKAVIYARVSSTTDRQDTARQVEDLRRYADANNIEIAKVFTEKVSGAKKRNERPELDKCLVYCVAQKIDLLLLSELSRLGRNPEDLLNNVMFCKNSGINVFFQKEQFSIFQADGTEHPFYLIFVSILATTAKMERENIRFRLKSGRDKYVRDGGKLGRLGYRKSLTDYERDYPAVFKELRRPDRLSYDRIARLSKVSKRTVITIADLLGLTRHSQPPLPDPLSPTNQKTEQ